MSTPALPTAAPCPRPTPLLSALAVFCLLVASALLLPGVGGADEGDTWSPIQRPPDGIALQPMTLPEDFPLTDVSEAGGYVRPSTTQLDFGSSWIRVRLEGNRLVLLAGAAGASTVERVARELDGPELAWNEQLLFVVGQPVASRQAVHVAVFVHVEHHAASESWHDDLWILSVPRFEGRGAPTITRFEAFRGHHHVAVSLSYDWGGELFVGPDGAMEIWSVQAEVGSSEIVEAQLQGGTLVRGGSECRTDGSIGLPFQSLWRVYRCSGVVAPPFPGEYMARGSPQGCRQVWLAGVLALDELDDWPMFPAYESRLPDELTPSCAWAVR